MRDVSGEADVSFWVCVCVCVGGGGGVTAGLVVTSERVKHSILLFGRMSWCLNVVSICHSSSSREWEWLFRTASITSVILLAASAPRLCWSNSHSERPDRFSCRPPNTRQPRTVHWPRLTLSSVFPHRRICVSSGPFDSFSLSIRASGCR